VSLVVRARDVDAGALDTLLHTLRAEAEPPLEILVTGHGPAARTVAERHAGEDWRVVAVDRPAPRGRYVAELGVTDEPAPGALRALARVLGRDAADVVVASRDEALAPGERVALADRPGLAGLATAGDALVARRTWSAAFTADPEAPRSRRLLTCLLGATHVDLVEGAVVAGIRPAPVRVFGAMDDPCADLPGWLDETGRESALLRQTPEAAKRAWAVSVARSGQRFLDAAERLSEDEWSSLVGRLSQACAPLTREDWMPLPWEARTKLWLAVEGERKRLEAFVVARRLEDGQVPTRTHEGDVLACPGPVADAVPGWCLVLAHDETPLVTSLRRMRAADDGAGVWFELFAFVRGVDLRDRAAATEVWLTAGDAHRVQVAVRAAVDPEATRFAGDRHQCYDAGVVQGEIDAATLSDALAASPDGRLQMVVVVTAGGVHRAGPVRHRDSSGSAAGFAGIETGGHRVTASVDAEQGLVFEAVAARPAKPPAHPVELDDARVEGDRLHLRGRWLTAPPSEWGLALVGSRVRVDAAVSGSADGAGFDAVITLRADPWGLGERPAPSGSYRIVLRVAGEDVPVGRGAMTAGALTARLPEWQLTSEHRVRLRRGPDGQLQLVLNAPLTDAELGAFAQNTLQQQYAADASPVDPDAVYLQSYTGESVTDSPAAIYEELRRRHPDVRVRYAVADRSVPVPEGAEPVLMRSQEWYDALATSAHLVTNIEMERWFRRRPEQQLLQTFHGYPSKTMGIGLWQAKGFTPSRIEQQLDRTARNWSTLLTPSPEMDVYYRENYRYEGTILAEGYPRDDALLAPTAAGVREATRSRLGIAAGQVAVLYAPTWRDDLATNYRSAEIGDHLDIDEAVERLGPDFVLLLRGHRFHARNSADRTRRTARVVDVTDYPEINDLVLASDAAVLDYSSLRFDFALTGRPMVFLVPDLGDYTGGTRGFLYDFPGSAPGPLVGSTAEVVAALSDLDGVAADHAEAYRTFNTTYNYLNDGHAAERVVDHFFRDLGAL
jgi:CDP-glycerol glycerophosphotransferase (TagB/SpsB family)